MSKVYVKDVREKEQLTSVFLVARKATAASRGGKPFIAVTLCDKTGELDARVWDRVTELDPLFAKGDHVHVEGLVQTFQGHPQLKIETVAKVDAAGLDPADFILPAKPAPDDRHLQALHEMVSRVHDPHVKALLENFLSDEAMMGAFRKAPAAKTVHHAHPGGLMEHTLSMMRLAHRIADHYPMADRDLMLAGTFLHDLAKVRELSSDKRTEYTDEGRLVGHLVLAAQLIHERAAALPGFPPALETHLCHIVLAHHGALEFGSPVLPQTIEAMLVHLIDKMDSTISSWLEVMRRDSNSAWTDYQKLYDRHLYKGAPPTAGGRAPVERRQRKRDEGERAKGGGEENRPGGAAEAEATGAAEGGDKQERRERRERPERAERHDRSDRSARPDRPERPERADRPERGPKKAEKLTFKPFSALIPTEPEAAPELPSEPTEERRTVEEPQVEASSEALPKGEAEAPLDESSQAQS